jgi:hypothetical protein
MRSLKIKDAGRKSRAHVKHSNASPEFAKYHCCNSRKPAWLLGYPSLPGKIPSPISSKVEICTKNEESSGGGATFGPSNCLDPHERGFSMPVPALLSIGGAR